MHMSAYLQRTGWGGDFSISSQTGGISELQKECCMQGALPLEPLKTVLLLSLGFMLVSID